MNALIIINCSKNIISVRELDLSDKYTTNSFQRIDETNLSFYLTLNQQ